MKHKKEHIGMNVILAGIFVAYLLLMTLGLVFNDSFVLSQGAVWSVQKAV